MPSQSKATWAAVGGGIVIIITILGAVASAASGLITIGGERSAVIAQVQRIEPLEKRTAALETWQGKTEVTIHELQKSDERQSNIEQAILQKLDAMQASISKTQQDVAKIAGKLERRTPND